MVDGGGGSADGAEAPARGRSLAGGRRQRELLDLGDAFASIEATANDAPPEDTTAAAAAAEAAKQRMLTGTLEIVL